MIKYKSEGFKYGATNPSHVKAVDRVIHFWVDYSAKKYGHWIIDQEWVEHYTLSFIREMKLDRSGKDHFEHTPDITFFQWVEDQPIPQLIIEIDGESHDSKLRKMSDGYFEEWLRFKYKGFCKLIRIQKRELIGDIELAHEHLRNVLGDYLQKK